MKVSALFRHFVLLAACASAQLLLPGTAAAQGQSGRPVKYWADTLQTLSNEKIHLLYKADLAGYIAALRAAADPADWASQFVVGNLVYRVAPAAALEFHVAAMKLNPGEGQTHLEIAYDYQQMGQCDRAIPAWQEADRLGALPSPVTAVAAYCFFKLGRINEGIALYKKMQWPAHRVRLDFDLSEMFVGSTAIQTHMDAYTRARAGDEQALQTLISNALDWRKDWWNVSTNRPAFDAARELARTLKPNDERLHRELECASKASAAKDDALLLVLRDCKLLIDGGEYPASSGVGRFLMSTMYSRNTVPVRELLDRFGGELEARARSAQGDRYALEILAFLQVRAREYAGLAATDELGWRRYRWPKFAGSRVLGQFRTGEEAAKARGEELLKEALRDFPDEVTLNRLNFERLPLSSPERERALIGWLLAEYNGLPSGTPGQVIGLPTSTTLTGIVYGLEMLRNGTVPKN